MLNVNLGKNSLNNFICHLSWFKKLSPTHTHPLKTIREFLKPCELLFFELVTRKMQPQSKGPGMLWGQSYVLPMTWGGGWRHWGPLSVDMQPYGCFIFGLGSVLCYMYLILWQRNWRVWHAFDTFSSVIFLWKRNIFVSYFSCLTIVAKMMGKCYKVHAVL